MKYLVTGSRDWPDRRIIDQVLTTIHVAVPGPHILIHGAARGADAIAAACATRLGWTVIPYPVTDADWKLKGKAAGVIRNQIMLLEHPDIAHVLAFTVGDSPGTKDMIDRARKAQIQTTIYDLDTYEERAAIMEFEGGMSREDADAAAVESIARPA